MVRNHQGNKQPIGPSLVNQTTSKADYTTFKKFDECGRAVKASDSNLIRVISWALPAQVRILLLSS